MLDMKCGQKYKSVIKNQFLIERHITLISRQNLLKKICFDKNKKPIKSMTSRKITIMYE